MSDPKQVQQRLMRLAREVDGLTWADLKCIGEAIALIDEVRGVDAEPVGEVAAAPGSSGGFTMAYFHASDVPAGTKLYTHPAPSKPARCPICHEERAHTGTCGSNDPRALCNQAPSQPVAPVELPVVAWFADDGDSQGLALKENAALRNCEPGTVAEALVKLSDAQAAIAAGRKAS